MAPSTQYRVTVRAKHLRAVGQAPPPGPPPEEAPGAYTDFRTLAKGLPDPPQVKIGSSLKIAVIYCQENDARHDAEQKCSKNNFSDGHPCPALLAGALTFVVLAVLLRFHVPNISMRPLHARRA